MVVARLFVAGIVAAVAETFFLSLTLEEKRNVP
jgi:hypothetical protein